MTLRAVTGCAAQSGDYVIADISTETSGCSSMTPSSDGCYGSDAPWQAEASRTRSAGFSGRFRGGSAPAGGIDWLNQMGGPLDQSICRSESPRALALVPILVLLVLLVALRCKAPQPGPIAMFTAAAVAVFGLRTRWETVAVAGARGCGTPSSSSTWCGRLRHLGAGLARDAAGRGAGRSTLGLGRPRALDSAPHIRRRSLSVVTSGSAHRLLNAPWGG